MKLKCWNITSNMATFHENKQVEIATVSSPPAPVSLQQPPPGSALVTPQPHTGSVSHLKREQAKTEMSEHMAFYKQSLLEAEVEIKHEHENGKALKDVIGKAFENHRERLWKYFGFGVSKDSHGARFKVDWSITYNGELVALEEDKGHYVDSCFLERAIAGFSKTVNSYQKEGIQIPVLILHSFTRYKLFNKKLEEDLDTRKLAIQEEVQKKLVYTTLVEGDRLSKEKWFSKDTYNSYTSNVSNTLIIKDIEFIRALIPTS